MSSLSKQYLRDQERVAAAGVERKLIRRPAVQKKTGLSRSSIYRLSAGGSFPPAVRLGPHSVSWVESEIDAWIAKRIAAREPVLDA